MKHTLTPERAIMKQTTLTLLTLLFAPLAAMQAADAPFPKKAAAKESALWAIRS